MFHRTYFTILLAVSLFLAGSLSALAQSAVLHGKANVKKAEGLVPAAEVSIEIYRTDITKGKAVMSTKTSKKGDFQFAGILYGVQYALVFSGPGIAPYVYPGVKAGLDNIAIELNEGDGRTLAEEDVRKAVSGALPAAESGLTPEQKKAEEDLAKKNAEITEKNNRTKSADETAARTFGEGNKALEAKDFDLAIAKYEEGIAAVPDYVGTTPILMSKKVIALKERALKTWKEGVGPDVTVKLAKNEAAKKDFTSALTLYDQAMKMVKTAPADPQTQKSRDGVKLELLLNGMDTHRLMSSTNVDTTKSAEATAVFDEYFAIEVDPVKKSRAKKTLGDIYRGDGELEKAIAVYKEILVTEPDNQQVMALIGLSLVGLGSSVDPANKEQLQEGLNYMEKYASTVQILDTDSPFDKEFKQSVKDTVVYLKQEGFTPKGLPKPAASPRKRG